MPELPTETSSWRGEKPVCAVDLPVAPAGADVGAEAAQRLHREAHVARVGAVGDRALARGERRQHQRPVGVVLGRRDDDLALERGLRPGYEKAHADVLPQSHWREIISRTSARRGIWASGSPVRGVSTNSSTPAAA